MIIYGVLYVIVSFLKLLFAPINLPDFPPELEIYLYQVLDAIKGGLPVLWVFFDKSVVVICLTLVFALVNAERIYGFIMFLLRKFKLE